MIARWHATQWCVAWTLNINCRQLRSTGLSAIFWPLEVCREFWSRLRLNLCFLVIQHMYSCTYCFFQTHAVSITFVHVYKTDGLWAKDRQQRQILITYQTIKSMSNYPFHRTTYWWNKSESFFYCCTVHFDNTYVLITNKCTSLLHI